MRRRRDAFTLLELMAVVGIICILAGLIVAGAQVAGRRAKIERSKAILNILAAGCERYWAIFHDYPMPNPSIVGLGSNTLGANAAFHSSPYWSSGWTNDAYNVTLVYLLSVPRQPEPLINTQQRWFQKIDQDISGPDGRKLFKAVDGFNNMIRVDRYYMTHDYAGDPVARWYTYNSSYIKLISAGPDGAFGSGTTDPTSADNIEVYLKR